MTDLIKKYPANIITGIRILLCIGLFFCPKLSLLFFAVYLAACATDVLDGIVARKTGTVSEFGSKLDTLADIIFVAVCMIKLLPVYSIPIWMYIWILVILIIKFINIMINYIKQNRFLSEHSVINKVTGALIFILPFTLSFIDILYSAAVVCAVATVAAIWEGYTVIKMPKAVDDTE